MPPPIASAKPPSDANATAIGRPGAAPAAACVRDVSAITSLPPFSLGETSSTRAAAAAARPGRLPTQSTQAAASDDQDPLRGAPPHLLTVNSDGSSCKAKTRLPVWYNY